MTFFFFSFKKRQKLVRIRFGCGLDSRIYGTKIKTKKILISYGYQTVGLIFSPRPSCLFSGHLVCLCSIKSLPLRSHTFRGPVFVQLSGLWSDYWLCHFHLSHTESLNAMWARKNKVQMSHSVGRNCKNIQYRTSRGCVVNNTTIVLLDIIFWVRPASWSSGQSLWLLIMRSRVRFPVLPWEFSLKGKIPAVIMVWAD